MVEVDGINYTIWGELEKLKDGGPTLQCQRVHSTVTKTEALN